MVLAALTSIQLVDRRPHVIDAHAGIALDHFKRTPTTHMHDGDEVDPCHDAVRRPVMAPVMDGEVVDLRLLACRPVLAPERIAARNSREARVLIGPAGVIEEHMAFGGFSMLLPGRQQ